MEPTPNGYIELKNDRDVHLASMVHFAARKKDDPKAANDIRPEVPLATAGYVFGPAGTIGLIGALIRAAHRETDVDDPIQAMAEETLGHLSSRSDLMKTIIEQVSENLKARQISGQTKS